jgi:DNA-binding NarL/FixJ family response regulator
MPTYPPPKPKVEIAQPWETNVLTTRIFIVEDHAIYRDGLTTLFSTAPYLEVVGEAASGEDALALIPEQQPHLVLMDLKLPGMSGTETTRQLVRLHPQLRVLILTMFDDDPSVFAAMQAGAHGYLLKGAKHSELLRATEAVAAGEAIFSADIAARMMQYFSSPAPGYGLVFAGLTEREHEVLALMAQGFGNAEIARRLALRPKTVRNYVSLIVSKLQVHNRAEAAEQARDRGM